MVDLNTFLLNVAATLGVPDNMRLQEITEWRNKLGKYCNSLQNLKTLVSQSENWQNIKLDEMVKAQVKASFVFASTEVQTCFKSWTADEPVQAFHWHIPLRDLHLKTLISKVELRQFSLVHGHFRSGKTSHRIALTNYLLQNGYRIFSVEFSQSWVDFRKEDFWTSLHTAFCFLNPTLPKFSDFLEFQNVFSHGPRTVILFDEFQQILITKFKDELLGTLKVIRSNAGLQASCFHGCIAFGTYDITNLTCDLTDSTPGSKNKISPFPSSETLYLSPPNPQQLTDILESYRKSTVPIFSSAIIPSIVNSCGSHLGIFGLLGKKLSQMIAKRKWLYSHWILELKDVYQIIHQNPVYSIIVESLQQDNGALLEYIQKNKLFNKATFLLNPSQSRDQLLVKGVLRFTSSPDLLEWTSPLIKDFIIQYVCLIGKQIFLPVPLRNKDIDFLNFFQMVGKTIDVKSIMEDDYQQTNNFDPLEFCIHAEFYRVMKTMILNSPFCDTYAVKFEGRVVSGEAKRRFDLLITNGLMAVLELKIKSNTNLKLQKAINKVSTYAEILNAHVAYVLNFTNFEPQSTGFELQPQKDNDDEMELDECSDVVPVKVIHLVYTNDWLQFKCALVN